MMRRVRAERGSASIELVLLAPAFGLVIALLVMGGRIMLAGQAIDGAASEAARVASLQRGASASAATDAARSYLAEQDLSCASIDVDVDTEAKASAPGTPGDIRATVRCDVSLGDLVIPGMTGSHEMTATATSPIDVYRER